MSNSTRFWYVSEKDLQDEIVYLKEQSCYQLPYNMEVKKYKKILRNIAYWRITKFKVFFLGVVCILMFAGIGIFANAYNKQVWINSSLLLILLIVTAVYGGLYLIVYLIFLIYKTKLSTK